MQNLSSDFKIDQAITKMTLNMQKTIFIFLFAVGLTLPACDSGPKVIESEAENDPSGIPAFENTPSANTPVDAGHTVSVSEILHTDKYTYLQVAENENQYWIATQRTEAEVGDQYFFRGGLLKQNFYSQEFDRVFETVYLVSDIRKIPSGAPDSPADASPGQKQAMEDIDLEVGNIKPAEGSVSIADLFANKENYNGKTIKVTGKVVKVNPMIMNRNWLHLKDNSSGEIDLTVTTVENISPGSVVTLEGTIALDRDFGAGYRYDVIMESAVLSN